MHDLFQRPSSVVNAREVIFWWELRRIPYNLTLLVCGLTLLSLYFLIAEFIVPETDYAEGVFFVSFIYGLSANLCYSAGWISELIMRKVSPSKSQAFGVKSFKFGFWFSVGITIIFGLVPPTMTLARLWID